MFVINLILLRYKFSIKFICYFFAVEPYIQFNLDQFVVSDEFFLNCLAVLVIIKFSELKDKNNILSFNLICMVIAIASLIKGRHLKYANNYINCSYCCCKYVFNSTGRCC